MESKSKGTLTKRGKFSQGGSSSGANDDEDDDCSRRRRRAFEETQKAIMINEMKSLVFDKVIHFIEKHETRLISYFPECTQGGLFHKNFLDQIIKYIFDAPEGGFEGLDTKDLRKIKKKVLSELADYDLITKIENHPIFQAIRVIVKNRP